MSTEAKFTYCNPEVWGGIECTINRIGDGYRDQLAETNHYSRADDLDKIAATGIRRIRYPVACDGKSKDSTEKSKKSTGRVLHKPDLTVL